jgi:hypothetical protein
VAKRQEFVGVPQRLAAQILNYLCKVCLLCKYRILLIIKLFKENAQADFT